MFFAWPALAGLLLFIASQRDPILPFGSRSSGPRWERLLWWHIDLWSVAVVLWAMLLLAWILRVAGRQRVNNRFNIPIDRALVQRDRRARRFTCLCFLIPLLLSGWRTDRCGHGEYWEWRGSLGVVRNAANGHPFIESHSALGFHLGGAWDMYYRDPARLH